MWSKEKIKNKTNLSWKVAVYICIHRIIANTHTHTHPTHPSNYTHTHTNKIRTVYHETHKKISILSIYNYIHKCTRHWQTYTYDQFLKALRIMIIEKSNDNLQIKNKIKQNKVYIYWKFRDNPMDKFIDVMSLWLNVIWNVCSI